MAHLQGVVVRRGPVQGGAAPRLGRRQPTHPVEQVALTACAVERAVQAPCTRGHAGRWAQGRGAQAGLEHRAGQSGGAPEIGRGGGHTGNGGRSLYFKGGLSTNNSLG